MTKQLEWRVEPLDPATGALSGKTETGRHFLADRPVHCGDVLELELEDGAWCRGRYEWSPESGAALHVGEHLHALSAECRVRWPTP